MCHDAAREPRILGSAQPRGAISRNEVPRSGRSRRVHNDELGTKYRLPRFASACNSDIGIAFVYHGACVTESFA
jgi:hypothetical protein